MVGTASILGLLMASAPPLVLWYGMRFTFDETAFGFPLGLLVAVLLITWVVTVAATLPPSLRVLQLPAPKVISRLVAS